MSKVHTNVIAKEDIMICLDQIPFKAESAQVDLITYYILGEIHIFNASVGSLIT